MLVCQTFDILKCVGNQIGDFYRYMLYGILIKDKSCAKYTRSQDGNF